MVRLAAFAVLSVFALDPCGGGGGNGGGGGTGGQAGAAPADNGGGAGGAADVAGTDGAPCRFFHNGWDYRTITSYDPGMAPLVGSVSGDAAFNDDGTFTEDYYIGDIGNSYKGTYTIANGILHTHDPNNGDTDAKIVCSDAMFEMVLTYSYPDGSPEIITGLHSKLDPANTNGK